jgi:hypothetical protein
VCSRFADLGLELFPREQETPALLGALQKSDIDKWRPIIKSAAIKAANKHATTEFDARFGS